jgi:hypothetical protein
MQPTDFPESDAELQKPDDMSDDECGRLPVAVGTRHEGKYPCIVSAFKPTDEEIDTLVNGGTIYLHVLGTGMPPVRLSTEIEADLPDTN